MLGNGGAIFWASAASAAVLGLCGVALCAWRRQRGGVRARRLTEPVRVGAAGSARMGGVGGTDNPMRKALVVKAAGGERKRGGR